MNKILEILKNQLVKWVDQFKLKNPQAYAIVAGSLYVIWLTLDTYLTNGALKDVEIEILGLSFYLLKTIGSVIVFLLTAVGAHTPQPIKQDESATIKKQIKE